MIPYRHRFYFILLNLCLSLTLAACANRYQHQAVVPFSDDVIDRAYLKLSLYQPLAARKLIDHAIDFYIDIEERNNEGLAIAYTASTDYFRYVTSKGYLETAKFIRINDAKVQPLALDKVTKLPLNGIILGESHLVETNYKKLIQRSSGRNRHYFVIHYYSKLFELYSNNLQIAQSCSALDAILKHYMLAKRIFPDHELRYNTAQFTSYEQQIESKKTRMNCDTVIYRYNTVSVKQK